MRKGARGALEPQQRGEHAERPQVGVVGFGVGLGDDVAEGGEVRVEVCWAGAVVVGVGVVIVIVTVGGGGHEGLEPDALGEVGLCEGDEVAEAGLHG